MALASHKCGLAQRTVGVACVLLTMVASLYPQSAGAQLCRGNPYKGCTAPGAACVIPGGGHGWCTDVPGLPRGERECTCSTTPPPRPPPAPLPPQPSATWCQASNICPDNAPLADRLFYIHDLGHRCVDVGPPASWAVGTPVLINACNGTAAQQIRVKEIDGSHDIGLSVKRPMVIKATRSARLVRPGRVPLKFCIGVHGGAVAPGATLELQACNALSPAQRFAVDGDAILMGSQTAGQVTRDFVVERKNGSTVERTPLVIATREVWEQEPLRIDARYFRFQAVDGSGAPPTSGFLTVADETHLVCAAQCGWGTVVQIDDHHPLLLTQLVHSIRVADGTTIRGYRAFTYQGPEIRSEVASAPAFEITGRAVRFTGLRLRGPNTGKATGILVVVQNPDPKAPLRNVWLDHLEISHWLKSGIRIGDTSVLTGCPQNGPWRCTNIAYPDPPIAHVIANFIHDNHYGSNTAGGAFTQNRANVFNGQENHSITSRAMGCRGGYAAMDNLFLSGTQHHDVDMHGSRHTHHWYDGWAGDYFDVGSDTFLATNHNNYNSNINQRGASCRFTAIHDDVFLQSARNAILNTWTYPRPPTEFPPTEYGNSFNTRDPTRGTLPVGDFDGDRTDDVFLATGAAWYYSSGGQAEWRYLNRMPERASDVLLGDFDGDGRTDVLTVHGSNIDVSWGGVSAWQTINVTASPLSDLAVGDFDGDGRSDLLLATGTQWFFASGGRNWVPFATHADRVADLRFGHFTDKTRTQILRVHHRRWEMTQWGMASWTDIGEAPVDSVTGLVTGDFDGDGHTDLATSILTPILMRPGLGMPSYKWRFTSPGHGSSWSYLGTSSSPIGTLSIGRFEGGSRTGVITWLNKYFYYTDVGHSSPQRLSRHVMR